MAFPCIKSDGGVDVIIYTTQAGGDRPIHGAFWAGEKWGWIPTSWTIEGQYAASFQSNLDIKMAIINGKVGIKKDGEVQVQIGGADSSDFKKIETSS